MITDTVDDLFTRLGSELDDLDLSVSSAGRVDDSSRKRVIRALDLASRQDMNRLRGDRADCTPFLQRITLTLDSNDTTYKRYKTTPRTREVIRVYDDSKALEGLQTYRTGGLGFVVEEGGRAVRLRNMVSDDIDGTLTAWVINDPIRLSRGTATTVTTSSFVLEATPTIGETETTDDYYNGSVGAIVAGTNVGTIFRVTDYVGSTRVATVQCDHGSLTSGATDNVYAFVLDVPPQLSDAVVLRAALICARTDSKMRESMTDLRAAYKEAYNEALVRIDKMNIGVLRTPRQAWDFMTGTESLT